MANINNLKKSYKNNNLGRDNTPSGDNIPSVDNIPNVSDIPRADRKKKNLNLTPAPLEEYTITGQIIDKNQQPISGVTITSTSGDLTTTNPKGEFNLNGEYSPDELFTVNIFKINYAQKEVNPFNLLNKIKNKGLLGIISLKDSKADLRQAIDLEIPLTKIQIKLLQASKFNLEAAKQQAMNKVIIQIKTVLIPQVLNLIAGFGITKASDFIGKEFSNMNATCPASLKELNNIIRKKNNLTKGLNNIMKFLKTIRVAVAAVAGFVTALDIVLKVINPIYLIFPVSGFGAPDFGRPLKFVIERLDTNIKKFKLISSGTLIIITILIQELQRVLNYLSLLDTLVEGCAIEGQLPQEQLSSDLLEATQEQSGQLSPVVTNVNGFEMEVISVDNVTVEGLKRRKAIARNKAGIIMLEGEPSFSSNDQILIDELVYYIQTNDLKAD